MTATIIHLDRPMTERQADIDRMCLAVADDALNGPTDQELFEIEAGSQAGCAICGQVGDCA